MKHFEFVAERDHWELKWTEYIHKLGRKVLGEFFPLNESQFT